MKDVTMKIDQTHAEITLNRPEKLNAISPEMLDKIMGFISELEERKEVRVVIIRGSGGNFSSGADLAGIGRFSSREAMHFHRKMNSLARMMNHSRMIFIAVLEGYALGGGFELSLSADIRICSSRAILGQPEIKMGLNAGAGGNAILPRIAGRGNAMYLVLTGEKVNAERARELGIVQVVCNEDSIEKEVLKLVETICSAPEISTSMAKLSINGAQESSVDYSLEIEALVFSMLADRPEVRERIKKFLKQET